MSSVLIVDDDPVSRLVLRHMLENQGHVVVEAESVDEAVALIDTSATPFQLVVCDYIMPERTGLDMLEHMPADTPFVLLTGELNQEDLNDPRVQNVSAYLTKPVASATLAEVTSNLLSSPTPSSRNCG